MLARRTLSCGMRRKVAHAFVHKCRIVAPTWTVEIKFTYGAMSMHLEKIREASQELTPTRAAFERSRNFGDVHVPQDFASFGIRVFRQIPHGQRGLDRWIVSKSRDQAR